MTLKMMRIVEAFIMNANKWLCVIQKTAPMELKNKIIAHLIERHKKGELSNDKHSANY
jgi:hypothetical protein